MRHAPAASALCLITARSRGATFVPAPMHNIEGTVSIMTQRFTFILNFEVALTEGKFAGREELAQAV